MADLNVQLSQNGLFFKEQTSKNILHRLYKPHIVFTQEI